MSCRGPRWCGTLTSQDRRALTGMATAIGALHVVGFGALLWLAVTGRYGLGVGVLAYTFGLRHAFDADHIAAVDNATRKLTADNTRPLTVGFWFGAGHSTVVAALTLALTFGVRAVAGQVRDSGSSLHHVAGIVGASVSGGFLLLLAALNTVALAGIVRVARGMRHGRYDPAQLDRHLAQRGIMARILGRTMGRLTRPRHMYPIGVLFGLGFDTATEIGVLALAAGAALTLPWWAILTLPVLFAAGMCLADAADGVFMCLAYGWAFDKPARRVFYNLTITAVSVLVAAAVGTVELAAAVTGRTVDLAGAGYWVVALFGGCWLAALAVWRYGHVEERWTPHDT